MTLFGQTLQPLGFGTQTPEETDARVGASIKPRRLKTVDAVTAML